MATTSSQRSSRNRRSRTQSRPSRPTGKSTGKSTSKTRGRSRSRHPPWAWAALLAVVVAVAIGAVAALGGGSGGHKTVNSFHSAGGPLSSSNGDTATALSGIQHVSSTPLLDGGRPFLFFMGGQFCPFCAADRWALVDATSRFGSWTDLRPLQSQSGTDGFASLPTYNLVGAHYQSQLFSLRHKEVADVSGNQLQPLDGFESGLVNAYDPGGSIPLVAAGGSSGQYTIALSFSPGVLQGLDYDTVRRSLAAGNNTPTVNAIRAEADAMTALICKLTEGNPAGVCSAPNIAALEGHLS